MSSRLFRPLVAVASVLGVFAVLCVVCTPATAGLGGSYSPVKCVDPCSAWKDSCYGCSLRNKKVDRVVGMGTGYDEAFNDHYCGVFYSGICWPEASNNNILWCSGYDGPTNDPTLPQCTRQITIAQPWNPNPYYDPNDPDHHVPPPPIYGDPNEPPIGAGGSGNTAGGS
jgi:hypothetical protein